MFFPPSPGLLALGALSGGKGDGEAFAVVLAVGAIIAFPFIAMGLAMGHPEPEEEVVDAVDRINTYNDELRERYAFCEALAGSQGVAP